MIYDPYSVSYQGDDRLPASSADDRSEGKSLQRSESLPPPGTSPIQGSSSRSEDRRGIGIGRPLPVGGEPTSRKAEPPTLVGRSSGLGSRGSSGLGSPGRSSIPEEPSGGGGQGERRLHPVGQKAQTARPPEEGQFELEIEEMSDAEEDDEMGVPALPGRSAALRARKDAFSPPFPQTLVSSSSRPRSLKGMEEENPQIDRRAWEGSGEAEIGFPPPPPR